MRKGGRSKRAASQGTQNNKTPQKRRRLKAKISAEQIKFEVVTAERLHSLVGEKWEIAKEFQLSHFQPPFPTPKLLHSSFKNNVGEIIDLAFPSECIELVQVGWNSRLGDARKNGNGTKYGKKVSPKTATSKRELTLTETYNFLGAVLLLCHSEKSDMGAAGAEA